MSRTARLVAALCVLSAWTAIAAAPAQGATLHWGSRYEVTPPQNEYRSPSAHRFFDNEATGAAGAPVCQRLGNSNGTASFSCGYGSVYRWIGSNLTIYYWAYVRNNYPYGGPLMSMFGRAQYETVS